MAQATSPRLLHDSVGLAAGAHVLRQRQLVSKRSEPWGSLSPFSAPPASGFLHVSAPRLQCRLQLHYPPPPPAFVAYCTAAMEKSPEHESFENSHVSIFGELSAGGHDVEESLEMQGWIEEIRQMFQNLGRGFISASAYDTAWVAMVPSLAGVEEPQFPQCLGWIVEHQLSDGSWGDKETFVASDRVLCTLACIVALKTWQIGHENQRRGVDFITHNIHKLDEEAIESMPVGFEICFPSILDDAKDLNVGDLPYDSPVVARIRNLREQKLQSIPIQTLYSHPTTLLHSIEGLHRILDWSKVIRFLGKDGSFLSSPAATACALKFTRDDRCLRYLNMVLNDFNNAAPTLYPLDIYERLWMVDRLERLGISRYFEEEIKKTLDYVYSHYTTRGLSCFVEAEVFNGESTAMGFRMLRQHGYPVSADVFATFKKGMEFCHLEGQVNDSISTVGNFLRASYVKLPGEAILDDLKHFAKTFLRGKLIKDKFEDKRVISKGIKDEIIYMLKHSWPQSLQRIEARSYISHYHVDDAWIGKVIYRLPYVNNEIFLKLAKVDYNTCQAIHQQDLAQLFRWIKECKFDTLGFTRKKVTTINLFLAATTLFDPEYSFARLAWASSAILVSIIDDLFDGRDSLHDLSVFLNAVKRWKPIYKESMSEDMTIIYMGLYNTMNTISQKAYQHQGWNVSQLLRDVWVKCVSAMYVEAQWRVSDHVPKFERYMSFVKNTIAVKQVALPTLFFLGDPISKEDLMSKQYTHIMDLTCTIARINNDIRTFERSREEGTCSCVSIFQKENPQSTNMEAIQHFEKLNESAMEHLIQACLCDTKISKHYRQLCFNIAKVTNFLYSETDAYSSPSKIYEHVQNVLFTLVI